MTNLAPPARATVYYDGACPVCAREVAMYRRQPGAALLCWVDAARCPESELGPDLGRDAALARLHLRLDDGRLVHGAVAFTQLWQRLPGWAWLGRRLGRGAGLRLLEAAYRAVLVLRPLWRRARASDATATRAELRR